MDVNLPKVVDRAPEGSEHPFPFSFKPDSVLPSAAQLFCLLFHTEASDASVRCYGTLGQSTGLHSNSSPLSREEPGTHRRRNEALSPYALI